MLYALINSQTFDVCFSHSTITTMLAAGWDVNRRMPFFAQYITVCTKQKRVLIWIDLEN